MLHSLLPVIAAAITSYFLSDALIDELGIDLAATLYPLLFAVFMASGMLFLGCCGSSFVPSAASQNKNGTAKHAKIEDSDDKNKNIKPYQSLPTTYVLPTRYARFHSTILLLVPAAMHVVMFRRRIISMHASMDEWYDLVLVWTVPYLLHYAIHNLHQSGRWEGPYNFPRSFFSNILFPRSGNTLRGAVIPLAVSLAASLAAQQQYLIPLCHQVTYQFKGHDLPSAAIVSAFLTVATLFMVIGGWIWGATSTETNEPLFGEFHEDVVQLCFALAGLCGGKAFGMPWGLIPLPILAFLGLSLWLTTRLVRFYF